MSDIRELRMKLDHMACLSGMSYKNIGILYDITEHLDKIDVEGGFDRLRELAEAERDGRVVIAPKKGDKLYYAPYPKGAIDCRGELFFLRNCGDGSGIVESVSITIKFDNWSGRVPIKKTWRTLEEAEAERALSSAGEGAE